MMKRNFIRRICVRFTFLISLVGAVGTATAATLRQPTPTVVNPVFRSELRGFLSLDGERQFELDPDEVGEKEQWFTTHRPFSRTIRVPGTSEAQGVGQPRLSHPTPIESYPILLRNEYLGVGSARKVFLLPAGGPGNACG